MLASICSAGLFTWLSLNQQQAVANHSRANERQTHTFQVLLSAKNYLSAYQDAEIGQRSYLLTRDERYLLAYQHAYRLAPKLIATLTHLAVDNVRQVANLAALGKLSATRLSELDQTVQLTRSGHFDEGVAIVRSREGTRAADMIRDRIAAIVAEENRLLKVHRDAADAAAQTADRYVGLLSGLGLLALLATVGASVSLMHVHDLRVASDARARSAARLLAKRALIQTIIDTSEDLIFVKDLQGRFVFVNHRVGTALGIRPSDAIGRDDSAFLERSIADVFMAVDQAIMTSGEPRTIEEILPEGGKLRNYLSAKVLWRVDGEIVGLIGISRDITELKQSQVDLLRINAELRSVLASLEAETKKRVAAEAQARQAQLELIHLSRRSAMGTMGMTIAHELNQPLTAVANYVRGSRLLLESGGPIDAVQEALTAADAATVHAGNVVRSIRDAVANREFRPKPEGLAQIVGDACGLARIDATARGVSIVLKLSPQVNDVFVDRVQVQQVLLNLLRNSVEAMSDSPTRRVVIASCPSGPDFCQITVRDTGPGISPNIMPRLFESFNTSKSDGNGIGLSISRTIIEAHNGRIWSQPCQTGAVFAFTLPYSL